MLQFQKIKQQNIKKTTLNCTKILDRKGANELNRSKINNCDFFE